MGAEPTAAPKCAELLEGGDKGSASQLDFRPFRKCERILDINAEIADSALDLGMAERSRVIIHLGLTH